MSSLNKSRILDGARWRPPTRLLKKEVVGKDGRTRHVEAVERLCGTRHIKALHPSGHVIFLVLGNANIQAEDGISPYYAQQLRAKTAKGFLPWGKCPVALVQAQEIPARMLKKESLREAAACVSGGFGSDNPCPHMLEERDYRQELHNARENTRAEAHRAEAERDRDQRDRHHEEMMKSQQETAKALQVAMETMASNGRQPPRKGQNDG